MRLCLVVYTKEEIAEEEENKEQEDSEDNSDENEDDKDYGKMLEGIDNNEKVEIVVD